LKTAYSIKSVGGKIYVYKTVSHRLGPFNSREEAKKMIELLRLEEPIALSDKEAGE